jgi:hypothetical protein
VDFRKSQVAARCRVKADGGPSIAGPLRRVRRWLAGRPILPMMVGSAVAIVVFGVILGIFGLVKPR